MKRVLVTGASKGIGKAIALRLAAEGYQILVHYNSDSYEADNVVQQIISVGGHAGSIQFDLFDRHTIKNKLLIDIEQNGMYWGIVCNAGIVNDSPFPLMSEEAWDSVLHTNLDGFYNVIQPLIMPLVETKKGGRIITLSSISGQIGNRGQVNYSAAKAGIIGATKALSKELARRKITVNCVAPGIIDTQMTANLPKDEVIKHIPMRRYGRPEEVASAVNWLISEEASYVTGQVISVNGGML